MDTQIEFIRYAADQALYVPSQLGLRPISVTMLVSLWTGVRQGLGTEIPNEPLVILNGQDGYFPCQYTPADPTQGQIDGYQKCNPRYRQVTAKEIAVSNGRLRDRDVVIGPLVYPYVVTDGYCSTASGGYDPLTFAPPINPSMDGPYFLLQGIDLPLTGVRYKLLFTKTDRNVMYRLYMRSVDAI